MQRHFSRSPSRCFGEPADVLQTTDGIRQSQRQRHTTSGEFSLPEGSEQNACSCFPSQTGFVGRVSDSLGVGVLLKLSYGGSVRSSPSFRCWFFHSRLFMATITRWISPLLLSVQKVKDKWHLLSEANAGMLLDFSPPDCKQWDSVFKPLIFEKFDYALTKPKCQNIEGAISSLKVCYPFFIKTSHWYWWIDALKREGRFLFLPPNPSHPMIKLLIKVYKVWNCRVKRNAKQLVNGEVWNQGCETADLICQVSFLSLLRWNPQKIRQLCRTGFELEKIFKRPVWDGYPEKGGFVCMWNPASRDN